MDLDKILCYFSFHKPKIIKGSDFEYICTRCHERIIDLKGFYSIASMERYYQEKLSQRLEEPEIIKNEAKTNPKE